MSKPTVSRRDFIKQCGILSLLLSGTSLYTRDLLYGFKKIENSAKPLVMFIQGQACTGCSISATYGNESDFLSFVVDIVKLQAHPNLSFAHGHSYEKIIEEMIEQKGYYLVLEGSVPSKIQEACYFMGKPLYQSLKTAIANAGAVVLSGTCAASGGIPAAPNNLTGAISGEEYIQRLGLKTPYIKIPGCPAHPDRLMGTVAYIVATGKLPELKNGAPRMYYDKTIHEQCARFGMFNENNYCESFRDSGCLLKKGCRGTITESDCPSRRWNGGANVCIESNAPCIGCIHPDFPFSTDLYLEPKEIDDLNWHELKKM
jgi:hydrogenase small subunit